MGISSRQKQTEKEMKSVCAWRDRWRENGETLAGSPGAPFAPGGPEGPWIP